MYAKTIVITRGLLFVSKESVQKINSEMTTANGFSIQSLKYDISNQTSAKKKYYGFVRSFI